MKCPNCGASVNDFGVYLGHNNIHCLNCGVYYNYKTGERTIKQAVRGGIE